MSVLRFVRAEVVPAMDTGERATANVTLLTAIVQVLLRLTSRAVVVSEGEGGGGNSLDGVTRAEVYAAVARGALESMSSDAAGGGGIIALEDEGRESESLPQWQGLLEQVAGWLVSRAVDEIPLEEAEQLLMQVLESVVKVVCGMGCGVCVVRAL